MSEPAVVVDWGEGVSRRYDTLVLDFSGTLARDGELMPGVAQRLETLARSLRLVVLTADTFGRARAQLAGLPVEVRIVGCGQEKVEFVRGCRPAQVIAIGNGRNDVPMMRAAGLSIAVIGPEAAAAELVRRADMVVTDVRDALDLVINPLRLKATLRD